MQIKHIAGSGLMISLFWIVAVILFGKDSESAGFAILGTPIIFVIGSLVALCVRLYQKYMSHTQNIRMLYILPIVLGLIFMILRWL